AGGRESYRRSAKESKPGKPPNTEDLHPISLTSCVGKVMEPVLLARWQNYLEDNQLYPETMIRSRQRLCTQDAVLQLKHRFVDRDTRDSRAVMGLYLQGAFDNVNHSVILIPVSKLNMGKRTHEYIRSSLTGRTAEIDAGDLAAEAN
ncbi:uncharacterized protein LOC144154790, partial [Haemaphysalis longicornis]